MLIHPLNDKLSLAIHLSNEWLALVKEIQSRVASDIIFVSNHFVFFTINFGKFSHGYLILENLGGLFKVFLHPFTVLAILGVKIHEEIFVSVNRVIEVFFVE